MYLLSCLTLPSTFYLIGYNLGLPPDTSLALSRTLFDFESEIPNPDNTPEAEALARRLFRSLAKVLKVEFQSTQTRVEVNVEVFVQRGTFANQIREIHRLIVEQLSIDPACDLCYPDLASFDSQAMKFEQLTTVRS